MLADESVESSVILACARMTADTGFHTKESINKTRIGHKTDISVNKFTFKSNYAGHAENTPKRLRVCAV